MDPDGFDTVHFPGLVFRVPRGLESYRDRLVQTFPSEKHGIDRYVRLLREVWLLQSRLAVPLRALAAIPRVRLALRYMRTTLAAFLDTCTRDVHLRALIAGQHGNYGQPPSRASAFVHALITMHYLQGAYYPRGGGAVIAEALASSFEKNGGKLLLRSQVRRIVVERGAACGVEFENPHLGRRVVRAPVIVCNADLKRTVRTLLPATTVAPRIARRVESYEMSPGLAICFLGVARDLAGEGLRAANHWIYSDYDLESGYRYAARGEFDERSFCYMTISSLKDPGGRYAPEGVANVELVTTVPSQPESWGVTPAEAESGAYRSSAAYAARKREVQDRLVAMAERVIPRLREAIVFAEVATPLTHTRFTRSSGGTPYGIASIPSQSLFSRVPMLPGIEGLYFCGSSSLSHGVAGAMRSGVAAVRRAAKAARVTGRS
jgi:phytoene dehydrogenase-like protein